MTQPETSVNNKLREKRNKANPKATNNTHRNKIQKNKLVEHQGNNTARGLRENV